MGPMKEALIFNYTMHEMMDEEGVVVLVGTQRVAQGVNQGAWERSV